MCEQTDKLSFFRTKERYSSAGRVKVDSHLDSRRSCHGQDRLAKGPRGRAGYEGRWRSGRWRSCSSSDASVKPRHLAVGFSHAADVWHSGLERSGGVDGSDQNHPSDRFHRKRSNSGKRAAGHARRDPEGSAGRGLSQMHSRGHGRRTLDGPLRRFRSGARAA